MKKAIEIGDTGRNVAANIVHLRKAHRLSLRALSEALRAAGRDLGQAAVQKIENGAKGDAEHSRRVDVDDLVAFARVLSVTAEQLLAPPSQLRDTVLGIEISVSYASSRPPIRRVDAITGEVTT